MRRFEYVEGSSAKFWSAGVEGATFVVVFGRLGTAGQRKEKAFPTEEAARSELEKKIAEKRKEGYAEVAATGDAGGEKGAKGAAAAGAKLALPPRVAARTPAADEVLAATEALAALEAEVGNRSWVVRKVVRRARRALERLGGYDPTRDAAMAPVFESLLALVVAPKGARRLSLRNAMELLAELDVAAYARALAVWSAAPAGAPAAAAVSVLAAQAKALDAPELALRLGVLLTERPDHGGYPEAGWAKRWKALAPHLEAHLAPRGVKLKDHLKTIDAAGDAHVKARVSKLRAA